MRWVRDWTRPGWKDEPVGRPLQIWRWRPARPGSGSVMRVEDYARLFAASALGPAAAPEAWPDAPSRALEVGYTPALPENGYARLAGIEVAARLRARPASRPFPLVVIAQGYAFESPFHQHVLAEYLASHGYVVLSAPLTGPTSPVAEVAPATLDAQVGDLERLLALGRRESGAPVRRSAIIGFDLGGMAAVDAATRLPELGALVGFDSGVLSPRLTSTLLSIRPSFAFSQVRAPYLHATRTAQENRARGLDESLAIFERAVSPYRLLLRIPDMRHADFTTAAAIESVHPNFWGAVQGAPAKAYAALLRTTCAFLDRHVKGQRRAMPLPARATLERWP